MGTTPPPYSLPFAAVVSGVYDLALASAIFSPPGQPSIAGRAMGN